MYFIQTSDCNKLLNELLKSHCSNENLKAKRLMPMVWRPLGKPGSIQIINKAAGVRASGELSLDISCQHFIKEAVIKRCRGRSWPRAAKLHLGWKDKPPTATAAESGWRGPTHFITASITFIWHGKHCCEAFYTQQSVVHLCWHKPANGVRPFVILQMLVKPILMC